MKDATQTEAAPTIEAIIHDLRSSHGKTSQGEWSKGDTTHHTVAKRGAGKPYRVAEFRHADDAQFCDLAHAFVPRLLDELERLKKQQAKLDAPLTQSAQDVLAERARQISAEGWTPERDDAYNRGVLAEAGGIYALHAFDPRRAKETPEGWPWAEAWWKPKDPRSNLVKAGALILAEIERMDRSFAAQAKQGGSA